MILNKVVIGVLLNKKSFKVSSLGGAIIDEVFALCETHKKLSDKFFTQFSSSNEMGNIHIKFVDDNETHSLTIQPDQVVYTKKAPNIGSAVNIDKALNEFEILWKLVDKIVGFPETRRIGIVGESHIEAESKTSASNQLVDALIKFPKPQHAGNFNLMFEDRELTSKGTIPDRNVDDYWNTIYSFYPSERDSEAPTDSKINANIDVQKYYNPAKKDPLREINNLKSKFSEKKKEFKATMNSLGLQ